MLKWKMSPYDETKKRNNRHGKRIYAEIKEDNEKISVSFIEEFKKPVNKSNITYIGFYHKKSRDLFKNAHIETFKNTEEVVEAIHACNRQFKPVKH